MGFWPSNNPCVSVASIVREVFIFFFYWFSWKNFNLGQLLVIFWGRKPKEHSFFGFEFPLIVFDYSTSFFSYYFSWGRNSIWIGRRSLSCPLVAKESLFWINRQAFSSKFLPFLVCFTCSGDPNHLVYFVLIHWSRIVPFCYVKFRVASCCSSTVILSTYSMACIILLLEHLARHVAAANFGWCFFSAPAATHGAWNMVKASTV